MCGKERTQGGREGGRTRDTSFSTRNQRRATRRHFSQTATNGTASVCLQRPLSAPVQICHLNVLLTSRFHTSLKPDTGARIHRANQAIEGEVNHGAARVRHARNCRWVLGTWSWYSKRAGLGGMYGLAGGQGGRGGVQHIPVIPPADPHQSKPLILTTEVRIRHPSSSNSPDRQRLCQYSVITNTGTPWYGTRDGRWGAGWVKVW